MQPLAADGQALVGPSQEYRMVDLTFPTLQIDGPDEVGIVTVAIHRPEAKNALDSATVAAIGTLLDATRSDASVRALVFTGSGKVFGIGADLPELSRATDPAATRQVIEAGHRVFDLLAAFPKPTAAAINGVFALGGSFELALACTYRVASSRTRMGLPEIKLGLIPGYGGTQRLPRLVGASRALELILSGEPIRAEEALGMGLVQRVVEPGNEVAEAKALLGKVLAHSPDAVAAALQAVHAAMSLPMAAGLQEEQRLFLAARATEAAQRGIDAQAKT